MKVNGYEVCDGLYYIEQHSWVKIEGETCKVGVTDYFQKMVRGWAFRKPTDIVYVGLPQVGLKARKGDPIASIESAKAVSDMHTPLSGEVMEVNIELLDNPGVIGESPYEKGWVAIIKPSHLEDEVKNLMTAEGYKKHLESLIDIKNQEYTEMLKKVGLQN
ncbi:glycine cleavage system protein GcvH [Candidatus Bathyarchaeota archaeon]|nr:glycine cleavage system protein GcvH [Candidatus Bathyarchaeota archaeon]MBS7628965.1 glycine cleavage system protein GcvH [Candidatus Bathyarchaeota archaeon]